MIDIVEGILRIPIMYDWEIENRKRRCDTEHDRWRMKHFVRLSNTNKLKNYFIEIRSIGREWITIELKYYSWFVGNITEKIIKLPINQLYSYSKDFLDELRELKGKHLNIKEIKYNHKYYYAEIDLNEILTNLDECKICFENNVKSIQTGYFNCSCKNLCNYCFVNLRNKICPFCRSN